MRDIITIDGPAGVGKSTLAKRVAAHAGVACLDTGAMFRVIAGRLGSAGLELSPATLEKELEKLSFSLSGSGYDTKFACNGIIAGEEIRTEEIGALASEFAQLPPVRTYLKKAQQVLGEEYALVAEGRDMGTVVFPNAKHKFFLDASAEVRAIRRVNQLRENGLEADIAMITAQIKERDDRDRNRTIAPLKPAKDAIIIDTSALTVDDVFESILRALQR